jgi:hypothetical protein
MVHMAGRHICFRRKETDMISVRIAVLVSLICSLGFIGLDYFVVQPVVKYGTRVTVTTGNGHLVTITHPASLLASSPDFFVLQNDETIVPSQPNSSPDGRQVRPGFRLALPNIVAGTLTVREGQYVTLEYSAPQELTVVDSLANSTRAGTELLIFGALFVFWMFAGGILALEMEHQRLSLALPLS